MQYTDTLTAAKIENIKWTKNGIFNTFAQKINCGCTLKPPRSNEYLQSMFGVKIRKIGKLLHAQFYCIEFVFNGVYFSWTCFPDGTYLDMIFLLAHYHHKSS